VTERHDKGSPAAAGLPSTSSDRGTGQAAAGPGCKRGQSVFGGAQGPVPALGHARQGLRNRTGQRQLLALSPPSQADASDDSFLRLADLLEHWRGRISGCELVVLSACKTQRGYMQRDEGVFALPWGFMYAGAPTVIASLWNVNDASTAELMSDFYRRLQSAEKAGASPTKLAAFKRGPKGTAEALSGALLLGAVHLYRRPKLTRVHEHLQGPARGFVS